MRTEGTLAFVGGEEWLDASETAALLLERQASQDHATVGSVAVIAAAAAYESAPAVTEAVASRMRDLGVGVEDLGLLMRADAENPEIAERVRNARFVYIADGSPLHLRSVLKDAPVWSALMDAWRAGATVVGVGAGATVLSDPMVDPRGGALTLGLQMTKGLVIVPRLHRWTEEWMRRLLHLVPRNTLVAEIADRSALVRWSDSGWESFGREPVKLFRNDEPISVEKITDFLK